MENSASLLTAIADDTRLKIIHLLLRRNYCVGALARRLALTEAAISQHIKVLREAGLLTGEKRGYFMHYDVNRDALHDLAAKFKELAAIQREACKPDEEGCGEKKREKCHVHKSDKACSEEVRSACHGKIEGEGCHKRESCTYHKS